MVPVNKTGGALEGYRIVKLVPDVDSGGALKVRQIVCLVRKIVVSDCNAGGALKERRIAFEVNKTGSRGALVERRAACWLEKLRFRTEMPEMLWKSAGLLFFISKTL